MTALSFDIARTTPRFARDEDGAVIPLSVVMFIIMLACVGMGVDIMRHETYRAEMQNALDRGLLAAADLNQTIDAETTVKEYFRSARWVGETITPEVEIDENTLRSRQISASASARFDTIFMRLIGFPEIKIQTGATARETRKNLEISLVLDISGTMRWCQDNSANCPDGNRIEKLIPAAQDFIDELLGDGADEYTSITIIPYAGQVNPGPTVFSALGGERTYGHMGSSCLRLQGEDFDNTGLPGLGSYEQVPHFHHWPIEEAWMEWGWCPSDNVAITYLSNNAAQLKESIEALRTNLHDGTGTNNAMKYGLALLDPASNGTIAPLIANPDFADRPSQFADTDTLKFIVLMTDGQITGQYYPEDPNHPDNATVEVQRSGGVESVNAVTTGTAVNQFLDLCDLAFDNRVVVFTIAYLAPTGAQDQMRNCAYDPDTHFYNIEDLDVSYAFQDIATTINKIKLVR